MTTTPGNTPRKYRCRIVAVDDEGYDDVGTYGEEWDFTTTPNTFGIIVAQLSILESGMVDLDTFLRIYVDGGARQKALDQLDAIGSV